MNSIAYEEQGIFDFESGNMNGFENWQREQDERVDQISREWSVPINRNVRLKLKFIGQEVEGKLTLPQHPEIIDRSEPLNLMLNRVKFVHTDIESCAMLD
ncbi:MAG: hypothetical protein AAF492_20060 [Verrucomicrobiota bacterium]